MVCHNLVNNSGFQVDLYFFRIKNLLLRMFHAEALHDQGCNKKCAVKEAERIITFTVVY